MKFNSQLAVLANDIKRNLTELRELQFEATHGNTTIAQMCVRQTQSVQKSIAFWRKQYAMELEDIKHGRGEYRNLSGSGR